MIAELAAGRTDNLTWGRFVIETGAAGNSDDSSPSPSAPNGHPEPPAAILKGVSRDD
jgi:hypothetical protein